MEKLNCNQLVHYVKPVYPQEARKHRVEGTVTLKAVITKTGELHDLEALSGDPLLIPAAVRAVEKWRYSPCIIESVAVEVRTQVLVNFNLRQ